MIFVPSSIILFFISTKFPILEFALMLDSGLISRGYLNSKLIVALGGRAAEIIVFGTNEVTQGATNDLENVYFWANQMVTKFGFSELGPIA